jgi:lipopolysaccharide heptosyltransferase I
MNRSADGSSGAGNHPSSFILHPSKILVLRLSALGDVIHAIPAVVALREAGARVSWVVEAPYAEMVEIVAGVPAIPVTMKRWGRHLIASRSQMAAARRALRGHDLAIDFQGLVKSAALGWLSGARVRYGFDRHAVREKPALLFTNRHVTIDRAKHVVEWNLQLAEAVVGTALSRPPERRPYIDFATGGFDQYRDSIVLLPGAGRRHKQWPADRFAQLARSIGERALVVWGPGDEQLARSIGARMAPPTTLRELAAILRGASVVVGADTGPLHLAAAVGTPVVGLYGPTDPRRNGPYGQLQRCVTSEDRSMEAISVEAVSSMVQDVVRHSK